jgi:hypothetical protein
VTGFGPLHGIHAQGADGVGQFPTRWRSRFADQVTKVTGGSLRRSGRIRTAMGSQFTTQRHQLFLHKHERNSTAQKNIRENIGWGRGQVTIKL